MKPALLVLAISVLPSIGCEATTVYVDIVRAANECADGKKLHADITAFDQERQKAKAAPAPAPAIPTDADWQAQRQAKIDAAAQPMLARLRRILPAIAKARRATALSSMVGMEYVPPELDATADLVKRYDAGEGAEDKLTELAVAKAKVQALEREVKAKN